METDWLIVFVAAAFGGAIVWVAARAHYRRRLTALRQQLDKSERGREYSAHQAAQTRKDIDKLRREISKIRRPVAGSTKAGAKPAIDVDPGVHTEPVHAAPALPPNGGFADTMPM